MIIKFYSIEELQKIFLEALFDNTDKVTKVSQDSVLNGLSFGISKIAQKVLKEIGIVESHLLPDEAYGVYLDNIAANFGVAVRFGASKSSTYVRVKGTPGTFYEMGTNTVSGNQGIIFDLEEDLTLDALGWGFIKVRSQTEGESSNIPALSLNGISPVPIGHDLITNDFAATGGRDIEQDDFFRKRIKEGSNILAESTLVKIENLLKLQNSDIFKVYQLGKTDEGIRVLGIATQNGVNLDAGELETLTDYIVPFISLADLDYTLYKDYKFELQNIVYYPIDIDFRCIVSAGYDVDEIRKDIQNALSRLVDYRYWDEQLNVLEWINVFDTIKHIEGIKYISSHYFIPVTDIIVPVNSLPRFRGFIMRDLDATVLVTSNILLPIYYPVF